MLGNFLIVRWNINRREKQRRLLLCVTKIQFPNPLAIGKASEAENLTRSEDFFCFGILCNVDSFAISLTVLLLRHKERIPKKEIVLIWFEGEVEGRISELSTSNLILIWRNSTKYIFKIVFGPNLCKDYVNSTFKF